VLLVTGHAELWHFVVLSALNGTVSAISIQEVLLVSGVVYVVGALSVLLSRSVRTLPRVSTTSSPAS
jgi:hypothetical protein